MIDMTVRAMIPADWSAVEAIYREGIAAVDPIGERPPRRRLVGLVVRGVEEVLQRTRQVPSARTRGVGEWCTTSRRAMPRA